MKYIYKVLSALHPDWGNGQVLGIKFHFPHPVIRTGGKQGQQDFPESK